MKKLLFLILISYMSFCATRTVAQSVDSLQVVIDSLSVKVAVLGHDLAYLKIDSEINALDENIQILSIQVGDMATDFRLAILSKHLKDSKTQLQKLYEVYEESIRIIKDRIDLLQPLVDSKKNLLSPIESAHISFRVTGIWTSYYNLKNKMSIIREALYE